MLVSIWDLDFYYKHSGINYDCMKISSFHKQKGDKINFITLPMHIDMKYDIMYITKKDDSLKNPPLRYLNNPNSRVWGAGFRYFTNYQLAPIILACRPDYLLYPELNDSFERANALQFFDYKGRRLPKVQDPENTFRKKKNLIIDTNFWAASTEDLVEVLTLLQTYPAIAFAEPISLRRLISESQLQDLFVQLNFTVDSRFIWKNNYGSTLEDAQKICDFFKKMNDITFSYVGEIGFKPIMGQHLESTEDVWKDLIRCLSIINLGKKYKTTFYIKEIESRFDTPYIHLFEVLNAWRKMPQLSLLEFLAAPYTKIRHCSCEEFYMHREWWADENIHAWMSVIKQKINDPNFIDLILSQWGDKSLSRLSINWSLIKKEI